MQSGPECPRNECEQHRRDADIAAAVILIGCAVVFTLIVAGLLVFVAIA